MNTNANKRSHLLTLTIEQQNALPLLMSGLSDREVAEHVGVRRETVTKWRNYHPAFKAELNLLRSALHDQTMDGIRNLVPQAIAALGAEMGNSENPNRGRIALEIMKMVHLPEKFPSYHGPETAEGIIMSEARHRKNRIMPIGEEVTDRDLLQMLKELEERLS